MDVVQASSCKGASCTQTLNDPSDDAWSSATGVVQAWLHGLALVRANHTLAEPTEPLFSEALRRLHGPSGPWTGEGRLGELQLPEGDKFEYDAMRGCTYWKPDTCYPAPSWLPKLIESIPNPGAPLLILEIRPFLGATSIALANALSYTRRKGFVVAADTWRGTSGIMGLKGTWMDYLPPEHGKSDPDIMYYQYARNELNHRPIGERASS